MVGCCGRVQTEWLDERLSVIIVKLVTRDVEL